MYQKIKYLPLWWNCEFEPELLQKISETLRRSTLKKFLQLEFPHIPIYSEELTLSHVLNELGIDNVDCPFTFKRTVMKMIYPEKSEGNFSILCR